MGKMQACGLLVWQKVKCANPNTIANPNTNPIPNINTKLTLSHIPNPKSTNPKLLARIPACPHSFYLIYAVMLWQCRDGRRVISVQVTALIVRQHLLASDHDCHSVARIYLKQEFSALSSVLVVFAIR